MVTSRGRTRTLLDKHKLVSVLKTTFRCKVETNTNINTNRCLVGSRRIYQASFDLKISENQRKQFKSGARMQAHGQPVSCKMDFTLSEHPYISISMKHFQALFNQ